jgi:hypothetical protein
MVRNCRLCAKIARNQMAKVGSHDADLVPDPPGDWPIELYFFKII